MRQNIEEAELICYPMGSFYSSVLVHLLPSGVGRAIALAGCPRVYVPNTGDDPEQRGMSVADGVEALWRHVRAVIQERRTHMPTDEFQHESLQDAKSIGEYLRAIIQGLETGHLDLSDDRGQLLLHPNGLLGLELRAQRNGNRAKLVLELSWTEDKGKTRADSLRVRSESAG